MRKVLISLMLVFACAFMSINVKASDDLDVKFLTMQRFSTDFVSKNSSLAFDLSGARFSKKFNDNVSAVLFPFFSTNSLYNNASAIKNDFLVWGVYEAYFKAEDIGVGIGMWRLGLGETPFYKTEKVYYPYRYIAKPLAYAKSSINAEDFGLYFNKSLVNNSLHLYLGYHSGEGFLGKKDVDNAGAASFTAVFYPMLESGDTLKDLSVSFSINAQARVTTQSTYHALLGYKFQNLLSASFELYGAYGASAADKVKAISTFFNVNVYNPLSVLFRFDYTNDNGAKETYLLGGLATKFFDQKLGVAATFALTKPTGVSATAKQFAVSSVYYF